MSRRLPVALTASLLVVASACLETAPPGDYGDPTSLGVATTSDGITLRLVTPRVGEPIALPLLEVVFEASVEPLAPLVITLERGRGQGTETWFAVPEGAPGPTQRFVAQLPLLHGDNPFLVRARVPGGGPSRRLDAVFRYDGDAPGVAVSLSAARDSRCTDEPLGLDARVGPVTRESEVCVSVAVSNGAVSEAPVVRVEAPGTAPVVAQAGAGDRYRATLPVEADATAELLVTVMDLEGRQVRVPATVTRDATAPTLTLEGGDAPLRTEANRVTVRGQASDALGVARVFLLSPGSGRFEVPLGPEGTFEATLQLDPGENVVEAVAEDAAGNATRATLRFVRDRLVRLRASTPTGSVLLRLDRAALEELLPVAAQRETELVRIPLRPAVRRTLAAIREPVLFGLDTSEWGTAERNLARLLRMTPDTADLAGSSLEELLTVAPAVSLPAPRLLAELLDIEPTDPFLPLDVVTDAVLEQLIGTHPRIVRDEEGEPAIAVQLFDALRELRPLAARFGPVGGHPGFLVGESQSEVLEPGFLLTVPATSRVEVFEGVDASRGAKDFLYRVDGDAALSLDFLSDEAGVVGIVDAPVVDLRFQLTENDAFLRAGARRDRRPDEARPGFFRGNGQAFGAALYEIEHIVAEAAYQRYAPNFASSFAATLRYDAGTIDDAAVLAWDRGWVTITTSGGIGNPPDPVFVWDVLAEVVQLRLHEGGVREGAADLAFRVEDLPIGLDAEGLVAALRPQLQAQEEELAARLVSRDSLVESGVDVYYVAAGEAGFLFLREDASPEDEARAGFFADGEFGVRTSTREALPGTADDVHHKLVPVAGETHFFEDQAGVLHRLEVVFVEAEEVGLRVTPVELAAGEGTP